MCTVAVLASNHAPVAQEFLKRGCPRSLRGRMWAQVMGSHIQSEHTDYFNDLKQQVLQYDLMVDKLIIKVRRKTGGFFLFLFPLWKQHIPMKHG